VAGWVFFVDRRAAGSDFRDRYRTLAWDEARTQLGPRRDGDFGYYETLTKWTRSGSFDADQETVGVQPESDSMTFNGSVWALSQQIFLPGGGGVPTDDPSYVRALEYYQERAYGPEFLWDWSGSPAAQQDFRGLITESDDRFRQATTAVGLVIVNHLISAADALLSSRGVQPPARLSLVPGASTTDHGWRAVVSVPMP